MRFPFLLLAVFCFGGNAFADFGGFTIERYASSISTADGIDGSRHEIQSSLFGNFETGDLESVAFTSQASARTVISQISDVQAEIGGLQIYFGASNDAQASPSSPAHPWSLGFGNYLSLFFYSDTAFTFSLSGTASRDGGFASADVFSIAPFSDLTAPVASSTGAPLQGTIEAGSYRLLFTADRGISGVSGSASGFGGLSSVGMEFSAVAVPEPTTWWLLIASFLGALITLKRGRKDYGPPRP